MISLTRSLSLVLLAGLMATAVVASEKKSKAIPEESPRLFVHASAFSLADPRVTLAKIKHARDIKDVSQVQALIKAYHENAKRGDGYGLSIQISILQTLTALKAPQALPFLLQEFKATDDPHYKDEMVKALEAIGDPKAVPALEAYLEVLQTRKPQDPLIQYQWQSYVTTVTKALQTLKAAP